MINGRELFAEISSEAVCEGGEVVGYFVRNNRMDTLEQMLCSTVTVKLPEAVSWEEQQYREEVIAALTTTGIKWEAE